MIKEYDPNIRWSRHTIELTFMQWDYSATIEVDVCGNCTGASLFDSAVHTAFDDLWDDDEQNSQIILKRPSVEEPGQQDELEVNFDDIDELASICVSAKFVKHVKESRE